MWILLVEDNPGDARLVRESFREAGLDAEICLAEDGERALEILRQPLSNRGNSLPNLILLDLNLPKLDGKAVLAQIKADPALRRIPVIVLSSSRDNRDILSSYDNFANCYISKPSSFEGCLEVAKGIYDFWTRIVSLPERSVGQATCG